MLAPAVAVAVALAVWLWWPSGSSASVQQATGKRYQVRLTVPDPRLGGNTLTLELAPSKADSVTVDPVMPQMGHALAPVPASPAGPGRYQAETTLPMTGQWEITVVVHDQSGADQIVFPLLVRG